MVAEDQQRNMLPVLDEQGRVTGDFYDRRLGPPPEQPDPKRFMAHLRWMRQTYPDKFRLRKGQEVEGFDHIDPWESEGVGGSILNMLKSGYMQSLTGMIERAVDTDEIANLFGLIDTEKMERWQPTLTEQIGSSIASFAMPADIAAIMTGGGAAAKIPMAGKIAARALTSAGALGTYEGARGFFEGYLDPEKDAIEEAGRGAVRGGMLGAALGGVGGAVAAKIPGPLGKAAAVPAEIFTLGTVAPLTEKRQPTKDDYIYAAGFIVGLKSFGALAGMPKRVFNRRLAAEARALERGEPLETLAEKAITENPDRYNGKFYRSLLKPENVEKDVGTLGDLVIGEEGRALLRGKDLLDTPIRVTRRVPTDQDATGWVDVDAKGKPKIFVNPDYPDQLAATLGHEIGHVVRHSRGRPLTAEGKELPVAEEAAERFGRHLFETKEGRMTERAVTVALKGKPVVQMTPNKAPKSFLRVTPERKLKPTQYVVTGGDAGRAKVGVYNVGSKEKPRKQWLLLDVSPKPGKTARDVVLDVAGKASERGQSLYLSNRLAKTRWFRGMESDGLLKKMKPYYKFVRPTPGIGSLMAPAKVLPAPKVVKPPVPVPKEPAEKGPAFRRVLAAKIGKPQDITSAEALGPKAVEIIKKGYQTIKPRFMYQARNTLKSPEGQNIATGMDQVYKTWHRMVGTFMEKIRQAGVIRRGFIERAVTGKYSMSDKEAFALPERLEKGQAPEIKAILDEFHATIAPIWEAAGLKLGKITHYFPRMFKQSIRDKLYKDITTIKSALKDAENWSDEVVRKVIVNKRLGVIKETNEGLITLLDKIVQSGEARTLKQALNVLDRQVQAEVFPSSGFEKRRRLRLPSTYFERDTRIVLPQYFNSMAKRAAELKVWGNHGEKALRLLEKIKVKDFDEWLRADKLVKIFTGVYEQEHGYKGKTKDFVDAWTAFQFSTKIALGRATILNATQPIISFGMEYGIWPTIRAATKLADPAHRSYLRQSGAVDRYLLEAAIGYKPGGPFAHWADKFGTASGFTGINKVLQYWAASTFEVKMHDLHRVANRATGQRQKWAQDNLKDFGVDWRRPLEAQREKMLEGIYRYATDSQLQANILRDPLFINDPRVRPFMIFKRFGIRQATYIKDVVVREAKRGNIMPVFRLAAAGFLGGEAIIWTLNKIKAMLSGEPAYRKEDTIQQRLFENLAIIGSFGMLSDIMEIEKASDLPRAAKFAITPVPFADAEKLFDTWSKWSKDWDTYDDGFLATERNAYNLFGFLGSYPRYAAERLKTPSQRENKIKFLKGREKAEIFQLLLDGHSEAASDRLRKWNKAYGNNKLTLSDISTTAMLKWVKRRAEMYAAASAKEGTTEYRKIVRKRIAELRKR